MKDDLKVIRERIKDNYVPSRCEHLRKLQGELLGIENPSTSGTHAYYPPLIRSTAEYQQANRTLNNIRLLTAQTRSDSMVPKWQGLAEELIEKARDAWWSQNSQGLNGYGGWKDDLDRAFMDFAALGIGVWRVGVAETDDYNYIQPQYRSPLHIITDAYATSPENSDWAVDISIYAMDAARVQFENADWENISATTFVGTENIAADGVIVYEYFHRNPPKGEPGYVAFEGSYESGKILEQGENPYGNEIPLVFALNFVPPGAKYPVGLVEMQSYAVKRLEEIDDLLRVYSERGTQVGVDAGLLEPDSWKKIQAGENPRWVPLADERMNAMGQGARVPFLAIPSGGAPPELMTERAIWEQYLRESSGVSSAQAGVVNEDRVTATEINQVAQQSSAQTAFLSREFARAMQRFASLAATVAEQFDNAPFTVTYQGIPVTFNTGNEALSSKYIFSGSKMAVLGDEELMAGDVAGRQAKDFAKWIGIYQITGNPNAVEKALESSGVKNPGLYMPVPQQSLGAPTGAPTAA